MANSLKRKASRNDVYSIAHFGSHIINLTCKGEKKNETKNRICSFDAVFALVEASSLYFLLFLVPGVPALLYFRFSSDDYILRAKAFFECFAQPLYHLAKRFDAFGGIVKIAGVVIVTLVVHIGYPATACNSAHEIGDPFVLYDILGILRLTE